MAAATVAAAALMERTSPMPSSSRMTSLWRQVSAWNDCASDSAHCAALEGSCCSDEALGDASWCRGRVEAVLLSMESSAW